MQMHNDHEEDTVDITTVTIIHTVQAIQKISSCIQQHVHNNMTFQYTPFEKFQEDIT